MRTQNKPQTESQLTTLARVGTDWLSGFNLCFALPLVEGVNRENVGADEEEWLDTEAH